MGRGWWLILVLCLAGCSSHFEKPVLTVVGVDLHKGSNILQPTFLVRFHIQNPNDRTLPVSALHADLVVAGDKIASGVSNHAFIVPPNGQTDFDMTITANMALVIMKLAAAPHPDAIDYLITGSADLDLPFMHNLAFQQSGSFSLRATQ